MATGARVGRTAVPVFSRVSYTEYNTNKLNEQDTAIYSGGLPPIPMVFSVHHGDRPSFSNSTRELGSLAMVKKQKSVVNLSGERQRLARLSMPEVAKEFTEAITAYQQFEAALESLRGQLHTLREAMLTKLGEHSGDDRAAITIAPKPGKVLRSVGPARLSSKPGAGPRAGSLGAFILEVLGDRKVHSVAEIIGSLRQTKYKSSGNPKSQMAMASQTLAKLVKWKLVSKKGRGRYAKAGD